MKWTSDIVTEPTREHELHAELEEGGHFRGRVYQDDSGKLQLRIYAGSETTIPIDWLLGIIQRFSEDVKAAQTTADMQGQAKKAIA